MAKRWWLFINGHRPAGSTNSLIYRLSSIVELRDKINECNTVKVNKAVDTETSVTLVKDICE